MTKYGGVTVVDGVEWTKEGTFFAYVARSEHGWGLVAAMKPGSFPQMLIGVDAAGLSRIWRDEIEALRAVGQEVKLVKLKMEAL